MQGTTNKLILSEYKKETDLIEKIDLEIKTKKESDFGRLTVAL